MLTGNLHVKVDDVLNYGCWCQIGQENEAFGSRKGKPIDKLDRQCQNWTRCYRCAVIDSDSDADKCDPMKQEYFVDFR